MYPKIRSPILVWALAAITGVYLFYWGYIVCKELNAAEEKSIFPVEKWKLNFFLVSLLLLASLFSLPPEQLGLPLLVAMLLLLFLMIQVFTALSVYIVEKQQQLQIEPRFNTFLGFMLLFFVANTGLIYLQSTINGIINKERARNLH